MLKNQKFKIKPRTGHPRNSVFPGGDPPVPDQVTGVQITGTTSSSVSASWNSANGATSYNIYVNDSLHTGGITLTSATISGLSSNTTYQISVAGQNSTGEGLRSSNMPATTQQIVSGARNRQLHPFPSDDPFNMPLGVNAWYAPTSDPATSQVRNNSMAAIINNGWSSPVYFPTTADPLHTFTTDPNDPNEFRKFVESYRSDEDGEKSFQNRLQLSADQAGFGADTYRDGMLCIVEDNDLIEIFRFKRNFDSSGNRLPSAVWRRAVRNRADRYCFASFSNPLRNRAGVRASGMSFFAGFVRKHEIDADVPHIPHALLMTGGVDKQLGTRGDGDPSSPLYDFSHMFPAHMFDFGGYSWGGGDVRMGMRFALDPSLVTNTFIEANAPNKYQRAIMYALRDYGVLVGEGSKSTSAIYVEQGVPNSIQTALIGTNSNLRWLAPYMRRVAGAGPVHRPLESHWDTWRNSNPPQGWGGGAPRVPYPSPLASL
jgi:hypothetical protein